MANPANTPESIRTAPVSFGGIARSIGPGLIISAAIVGSGELIVTTKLGAEQGFSLLWFIIIGCIVKVFVQVELGRYAITQGKSTLDAMNSVPGPRVLRVGWMVWVWILMFIATFFQLGGIVNSISGVFTIGGSQLREVYWAIIIAGSCSILLTLGRYQFVEKFSTGMVALFTLFTIAAVFSLNWTDYAIHTSDIVEGLKFRVPDSIGTAFGAFGIIGVGASELIYYPYWCLEKGYATYVGPQELDPDTGRPTEEWSTRAASWIRVLKIDAWVSLVIYTGATIAFYLLGAATLHSRGLAVDNISLMPVLSSMYRESFGAVGLWIFIIGAFIVLYSTVFIATATNARLFVDLFRVFRVIDPNDKQKKSRIVWWTCLLLPLLYLAISMIFEEEPVNLVFAGAIGQALMLPFLAGASLYFHYAVTPERLKPRIAWVVALWISALLMASVGIYQLVEKAGAKAAPAQPASQAVEESGESSP